MKILHTSDFHIGKTLYGRKCYKEFKLFLDWLIETIEKENISALLIAGDIFDSATPSTKSQELYYSFLNDLSNSNCQNVVIIGGNHDSPSLLNAPKSLLKHLKVHVIGSISHSLEDEVLTLLDKQGNTQLIVCAVPFLRDRDVRKSKPGEEIEEKSQNLIRGIENHYQKVVEIAKLRNSLNLPVPLICMGHLFAAGGKTHDENEIRELYVGNLAHVPATAFPSSIDYIALGHLHTAQIVNNTENIRYSGSPLQLSFSQKTEDKTVTIISIDKHFHISTKSVPSFLNLLSLRGKKQNILSDIDTLLNRSTSDTPYPYLIEIIYEGNNIEDLMERVREITEGTAIEVIRTVSKKIYDQALRQQNETEMLEELSETDVFARCLKAHNVDEKEWEELQFCYHEILQLITEEE